MARVKLTKTELKAQKEALTRFQRFLPMLQLKKQQLQAEISSMRTRIEDLEGKRESELKVMSSWVGLLADRSVEVPVFLDEVLESHGNIAGVAIPVYEGIKTHQDEVDLFATPPWVDDAAQSARLLMELNAEIGIIEKQIELISEDLRTTSQRVNLFEKVKIPECRENIRLINIAIGDEQTAAVTRGKLAKGRDKSAGTSESGEEDVA